MRRAIKGTYELIRVPEVSDPSPAEAISEVRVRRHDVSRFHARRVRSWQVAPLNLEAKLRRELKSYVHLPENWDGEGAIAPSRAAVDDALIFLNGRPSDIPLPRPDQGSDGDVGIFWDIKDIHVFAEVTFLGDGTFAYFAVCGVPGALAERCGSDNGDVSESWPDDLLRTLRNITVPD